MAFDLTFGQCPHPIHEAIPLRDGNAQLLLDCLRIEAGVVRHLDGRHDTIHGDSQCVVADHPHRGWGCRRRQRAVTGRGEQ